MAIIRRQAPDIDLPTLARKYEEAKEFAEKATAHADHLKKMLSEAVDKQGTADDKGHLWLDAGPYDLKRERRVSKSLDSKAAMKWLEEQGGDIYDDVVEQVPTVNEDRLLALAWETPELAEEVGSLFKEKEIWAFKLTKKKGYDDEDFGD